MTTSHQGAQRHGRNPHRATRPLENLFSATLIALLSAATFAGCGDDEGASGPEKIAQADAVNDAGTGDVAIQDSATTDTGTRCNPCKDNASCVKGGNGAACVDFGAAGAFCGAACTEDKDCGDGFACQDVKDIEGKDLKQCVPKAKDGAPAGSFGECTCSDDAIAGKLETVCTATAKDKDGKTIGTCKGVRACGDSGLSACSAATPAPDKCDGVDNDCNGKIDDGETCDDANPCTDDSCGGKDGCKNTNNTASCDDGQKCTEKDTCADGKCAGAQLICDDKNDCTNDVCDKDKGCVSTVDNTNKCSDGNACTEADKCVKGQCAGKNVDCNDNNVCTDDLCNPKSGCANTPNTAKCDDKSACTKDDKCVVGLCKGVTVVCDDSNPCTDDACDIAKGCTQTNNTAPCDADNNACTVGDFCAVGLCKSGTPTVCDDDNTCTKDSCDKKTGACVFDVLKDGTACTDGTVCTKNDKCAKSQCKGELINCDDQKLCTADSCDPKKGCQHKNLDGKDCDDDNPCTLKDKCGGGSCKPGATRPCPTPDFCIIGKCSPVNGKCSYQNKPTGTKCTDGTACTEKDGCNKGACVGKALNCDDGNPCTDDSCDLAKGCTQVNNKATCEDGSKCTIGDVCGAGKCKSGNKKVCDDGNVCTADTCDAQTGNCKFANLQTSCDDGSKCTKGDTCAGGLCIGKAVNCDDGNPCTDDTCKKDTGCSNVANKAPCNDNDKCTDFDKCAGGKCAGTPKVPAKDCDDGNPCTTDTCVKTLGCQHKNNTSACDDGNKCTKGDVCKDGKCHSGGNTCGCQVQSDCSKQEDDSLCNGTLMCQSNKCVVNPITVVTCATADDTICAVNTCDKKTGQCALLARNEGKPCDADGSVCTASDACLKGKCKAGKLLNCDDKNPCTNDSCDPKKGCAHKANTAACDADNDACTVGDVCKDKLCTKGKPKVCNDNESCTLDSCEKATGKCLFNAKARDGQKCDADGSVCTVSDTCAAGKCVAGKPRVCDDKNPCTNDTCDAKKGCLHAANTAPCDADGNACTVADTCKDKVCVKGKLTLCDDGNPCTVDSCDKKTGTCVFDGKPQEGKGCDADGSVCTNADSCVAGKCIAGKPLPCDDENPCTNDSCDKVKGCQYAVNSAPCNADNSACTVGDTCVNKVCKAGTKKVCSDGNPCTADSCNAKTGKCEVKNLTTACDDGTKCTNNDTCKDGACVGTPVKCDDNNVCTDDSCDKAKGCVNTPNKSPCNDNNKCTDFDVCASGNCAGKPKDIAKDCNDGNSCTNDNCDKTKGCVHEATTGKCDDGDSCTKNDVCDSGKCKPGPSICACKQDKDCAKQEDGNLCNGTLMCKANKCVVNTSTIVTCDSSSDTACQKNTCTTSTGKCGMTNINEGKACDADSSVCTSNDKCVSGKCTAGATLTCDDKNPCTNDSCDKVKGCVFTANTAACNADNNACTVGDTCKDKLCVPGGSKKCDDGKVCTADSCDTKTGKCVFATAPLEGKPCDADGNVCTGSDACKAGACVAGATIKCDDGNVCTTDSCDKVKGCQSAANTASCDADGNACTANDACKDKTCIAGTLKVCNDKNPCTVDSCDKKTGKCVYDAAALEGKGCDADGSVCTVSDTCKSGKCTAGATLKCDDGNVCTTDSCDKAKGCVNAANTAGCNADDNACTVSDVCKDKVCTAGPIKTCNDGKFCTVDSCDKKTAACTNNATVQEGKACDADGSVCTENDTCKAGVCTPGPTKKCDDSNVCTDDSCDKLLGCQIKANTAPCNADSSACTVGDACKDKQCVAGPLKSCDDANVCTVDSCDGATGKCAHDAGAMNGKTCGAKKRCKDGVCATTGKN